jgi:carboxymethylenebutenolidase
MRYNGSGLVFLRSLPEVNPNRIAVAGHSSGGQLALLLIERDSRVRAAVVFGAAAASWNNSALLRSRLLTAVRLTTAPAFFIHAENDFSVAPGKALAAEMTRLEKRNRLKIFPRVGQTPGEGHDFVYSRPSEWVPDVFAFLNECMR